MLRWALRVLAVFTMLSPAATQAARPLRYALPAETIAAELSHEDAAAVVANCSGCHSLDYLTTQPRGKGAQFWRDSVAKMINVYKAPIAPADAETVARILADRFGR